MIFAVIVCVIGLISAILVGKMMGFNAGQAGGLAAGALTQSSVIGVAQDAISKLDISNQKQMMDFVPVGYAVTYIFWDAWMYLYFNDIRTKDFRC